jgi:uncharacterized phage protein (TIGR02218 family)
MKAHVVPYETRVQCGRVVCRNGLTIRIAAYPFDLTMSNGAVYQAGAGFEYSGLSAETSFAASVVDLEGFVGYAGVTRDMLQSGVFDGAEAFCFYADFLNPVEDDQEHLQAIFGKTEISDDRYRIEQMSFSDLLSQDSSQSHTAICAHVRDFGGQGYGGCGVNLVAITVTGTLTHVTSSLVIRDSTRGEAADRFGWGTIAFSSGANAGLGVIKISDYAADGTITLYEPPFYPLAPGDAYIMTPGCRGTIAACQGYSNIGRRRAFDWIPLGSTVRSVGGAS